MDFWNDQRVGQLLDMRAAGLTFGQIAAALDGQVSRNAIVGKYDRVTSKMGGG